MSKHFSSLPFYVENSCLGCGERICICDEKENFIKPILKHSIQKKSTKGDTGETGATGATGAPGNPGAPGFPGTDGANGTNGTTGATGATGTNGTNGATGTTGVNGTTGNTGVTGATGATGEPGKNSSEVISELIGHILIPYGVNLIQNLDIKEYTLPDPDIPSKVEIQLLNKETKPIIINTSSGSFTLSSAEYYKHLVYNKEWYTLGYSSDFFPTKKKLEIEIHKHIKCVALSKNGNNLIIISNTPMIYDLKNDKIFKITNLENPQSCVISEDGNIAVVTVKEAVSYMRSSVIEEKSVYKSLIYYNGVYKNTLDGLCEKINNSFCLIRNGETLKTVNLERTIEVTNLDASINTLSANYDTLVISTKSIVQLYAFSDNKWVISKQFSTPDSGISQLAKISTDSRILAVATDNKIDEGICQKIIVYKFNGISYLLQTVLTFGNSITTEGTLQHLELSNNGSVIAWSNSKDVHIIVQTGEKWYLLKTLSFPTLVTGISLSGNGKKLAVWSNELIYIYN